jgi:hypothetical protein
MKAVSLSGKYYFCSEISIFCHMNYITFITMSTEQLVKLGSFDYNLREEKTNITKIKNGLNAS